MSEVHLHEKTLGKRDIFLFCISAVLLLDTLAAGAVMGPAVKMLLRLKPRRCHLRFVRDDKPQIVVAIHSGGRA